MGSVSLAFFWSTCSPSITLANDKALLFASMQIIKMPYVIKRQSQNNSLGWYLRIIVQRPRLLQFPTHDFSFNFCWIRKYGFIWCSNIQPLIKFLQRHYKETWRRGGDGCLRCMCVARSVHLLWQSTNKASTQVNMSNKSKCLLFNLCLKLIRFRF